MSTDPPQRPTPPGVPASGPKPYPVPPPLEPDPPPAPEPPKPSAADLLPPVDQPVRRARRAEREAAERRGRRGRRTSRRRRTWPQRILLSLMILGVVAAASGAALASYGLDKIESIVRVPVALSQPSAPGAPENFLVVGSDTRDTLEGSGLDEAGFNGDGAEGSGQRSDTIMVVRVDPAATSVDVLSFPRDLWLPIAGTGRSQRINTAYAGGPQRLVDTIEQNFDIPIHHYVEVDFAGFAGLVEALGGVPVYFDTPMRDTHSGLVIDSAGCHTLDPAQALAFARARHVEYRTDDGWSVDGTADLGRITRQQVFLRRALDQVGDVGITDPVTLNRLADVAIDNLTFDESLGLDDMLDLGQRFSSVDGNAMRTHALPVYNWRTSGGAAVVGVDEVAAQPILNYFRGLPLDTLYPVQVEHVTVLNGTGEVGQAALVADALDEVGFGVDGVGDVEEGPVARTRIRHAPGADALADLLERHLTAGAELVVDPSLDDGELVLETGTDFTTIGRRPRPATERPTTTTTTSTTVDDPSSTSSTLEGEEVDGDDEGASTSTTDTTEPIGVAPDPSTTCD